MNDNNWETKKGITYADGIPTEYSDSINVKKLPPTFLVRDKDWNFKVVVVVPPKHEVIHISNNSQEETELLIYLKKEFETYDLDSKKAAVEHLQSLLDIFLIEKLEDSLEEESENLMQLNIEWENNENTATFDSVLESEPVFEDIEDYSDLMNVLGL